jgi:ABC-type phosphate transport system ATPase subunit
MAGTPKSFLQEVLDFSSRGTGTALNVDAELARVAESIGLEAAQMTAQWLTLSGGQRQRACIALALILACSLPPCKSPVVLFDEPTAACDEESKIQVESAIISSGVAAILITHDLQQAMRLAHKRAVITLDETLQEDTQVVAV